MCPAYLLYKHAWQCERLGENICQNSEKSCSRMKDPLKIANNFFIVSCLSTSPAAKLRCQRELTSSPMQPRHLRTCIAPNGCADRAVLGSSLTSTILRVFIQAPICSQPLSALLYSPAFVALLTSAKTPGLARVWPVSTGRIRILRHDEDSHVESSDPRKC